MARVLRGVDADALAVAGRTAPPFELASRRDAVPVALVSSSIETALGPMVAVAAGERLCLLEFADRRMLPTQLRRVERRFRGPIKPGEASVFGQLQTELGEYFTGSRRRFDTPLATVGSPWQEACWTVLRAIPYGETLSYGEGAAAAGRPEAIRAFGRANGDNRLAILVPCHRVVGAGGALIGYGGGLWRKAALLELERAAQGVFERRKMGHIVATASNLDEALARARRARSLLRWADTPASDAERLPRHESLSDDPATVGSAVETTKASDSARYEGSR